MGVTLETVKNTLIKKFAGPASSARFPPLSRWDRLWLKHASTNQTFKHKIEDQTLSFKNPWEFLLSYEEIFEHEIYRFDSPRADPVIIDCGANIGMSVLYFKMLFPDSKLIAFEPDEGNFDLLEQNARNNQWEKIELHKKAVWIHGDGISFESSGSQVSHITQNKNNGRLVESVRLADLLQTSVDFLKIDIEGAEYEVIKDCKDKLDKVSNLFLEYHGTLRENEQLIELLQILRENGLYFYIENAGNPLRQPFHKKVSGHDFDLQLNIFAYRL